MNSHYSIAITDNLLFLLYKFHILLLAFCEKSLKVKKKKRKNRNLLSFCSKYSIVSNCRIGQILGGAERHEEKLDFVQ